MKYRYVITREIQSQLDRENLGSDVRERLKKYLQSDCPINASMLMANLFVDKIRNHSGLRFVWFQEIRQDVCIYILRRIYKHDEYIKKLNEVTKQNWMKRHSLTSDERKEVDCVFAQFFKEEKRVPLPEEFRKYEDKRAFDKNRDIIIYEMPLWNEGMRKVPKDHWGFIQIALSENILNDFEQIGIFMFHSTSNYTITFRFGNPNAIDKSDIYLLQIVKGKEPNLDELLDRKYDCDNVNDLQNYSSKCYPDYYTYDYEAWKDVEEDDMANLALSEEEIKVLQNAKFPFFVSGLAGSGKSTILYYLYANIYKFVAREHPDHNLLFLSYNEMLVDKARLSVKSILSYHKSNQDFEFKEYFKKEENLLHFNKCFVPFREFLKMAFLDEYTILRFSEEKHISYETFRELYQAEYKQAGKRLSPSIVWSVIRTFIKGRNLQYFCPLDYESDAISRSDRTVDSKVYEEVYKIWDSWYRHYYEDGERWDDLDLVRFALTNGDFQNVFHNYSVIFCDEAQDFTKLEIDLILSLSKHSQYNLSYNPDDKRIPIAFAGDPNQTINPTGFRWAGTKAIFNKSFEEALTGFPDLDDQELSKNYRSQLGIVKFANTIQSIRYKYFDATSKDRKLQSVREDLKGEHKDALEYVGFYSFDKNKDTILKNLSSANIITSGDGDEGDISIFPDIKDENVKLNTAAGTKGLEYDAVMLLNFSTDPAMRLFQKIVKDEPFASESERFELAHFFTKLYIAVSRAKSQLFIVDTDESYEIFWKYFTDHLLWEELILRFVHDDDKRILVGHITIGDIETLPDRLSASYDAEENGRQAFEQAKSERSISKMKRAQSYFLEARLTALADECDAYIYLYNMDYEKAGDKFLSLNQSDKVQVAFNAFWKGNCWAKIISIASNKSDYVPYDNIRLIAAKFMEGQNSNVEFLQSLVEKIDYFQDAIASHPDDQSIWVTIFDKMCDKLKMVDAVNISLTLTYNLDYISKFIKWYNKGLASLRADLYFRRDEFHNHGIEKGNSAFRKDGYVKAISIWEECGLTINNKNYYKAKKLTSKNFSEEIVWMDALNEYEEIVKNYADFSKAKDLTDEAAGIVFSCLLNKDYSLAVAYPFPKDNKIKWNRLYAQNPVRFLTDVVLEDFSPEKYWFINDKIILEEKTIFDQKLPTAVYDMIFSLNEIDENNRPHWNYFTSLLKDAHGERVIKSEINKVSVLEALSNKIKSSEEYDKAMASCFLEMIFDKDYNPRRADNYKSTIIFIFSHDVFFKEDFRRITERNRYFTTFTNLDADEHDTIKTNIRKYVDFYLNGIKKLSSSSIKDVKAIMRAYEVSVPYQGSMPDYLNIFNMYKKLIKQEKFSKMKNWLDCRMLFNQFLDDYCLQKASFSKFMKSLEEKNYNINDVTNDFFKEDASAFVAIINTIDEPYSYEKTLVSSKLIYAHRLRRDNLKPYCRVNDLIAKIPDEIDVAIDEVLANKGHINDYAIKLLTYTWEALYERSFVANHYDVLVNKPRLARLHVLTEYLKKRALLHYSYIKDRLFKEKQKEYGISMSRDYLPSAYPRIEEKNLNKGSEKILDKSDEKTNDIDNVTSTQTNQDHKQKRNTKKTINKDVTKMKSDLDPAMAAKLELLKSASNLKQMGVAIDIIRQAFPQLTTEEILNL